MRHPKTFEEWNNNKYKAAWRWEDTGLRAAWDARNEDFEALEVELDAWRRQRNALVEENVRLRKSLAEMVGLFDERVFNPSFALDEIGRAKDALGISAGLSTDCQSDKK